MTFLVNLADRVLNRPLLITPEKAQVAISILGNRIGVNVPAADRFEGSPTVTDAKGDVHRTPYRVAGTGTAILSIVGSLVNRGAYIGAESGLVSYEGIKRQMKHAASNPAIENVILDLQSPGGEAVGAFETAEQVRILASIKPVIAVVNGMAASAAYAIASAATEIVTTETGVSGSIGVVLVHADFSEQLAEDGIKPTLIFAGAHKVDGNPFEPLPDTVRADLQAEVNAFYDQFISTVALGRGDRLTADMARATEARTFIGAAAVERGLADRIGSFETVLADLTGVRSGRTHSQAKGLSMSENNGAPVAEQNPGISQADHDAAVTGARAEGREAGALAERERLNAVLGAESINGHSKRMVAAMDLACKSPAMSADDVVGFVAGNIAVSDGEPIVEGQMGLAGRLSDADPIGEAAGGTGKPEGSGLADAVSAGIEKLNRR